MTKRFFSILLLVSVLLMTFTMRNSAKAEEIQPENYAAVTSYVGENENYSITGSKTPKVEVKYDELDLKWYEADLSVGRNVSGWWIGIKITAPEAIGKETLKKSTFERYGTVKKFWNVKDSNENDDVQYFQAWVYVDKEKLKSNDGVLTVCTYKFDWNNDGEYEQIIDVRVEPEIVKLNQDEDVVAVTIGNKVYTLKKGKTLNDLTDTEKEYLAKVTTALEGKVFVGLFKEDGTKLAYDEKITEDMIVDVRFEDIVKDTEEEKTSEENASEEKTSEEKTSEEKTSEEKTSEEKTSEEKTSEEKKSEEKTSEEKDDTPKTGITNIIGYVAIVTVVSAIGIIVLNKKH